MASVGSLPILSPSPKTPASAWAPCFGQRTDVSVPATPALALSSGISPPGDQQGFDQESQEPVPHWSEAHSESFISQRQRLLPVSNENVKASEATQGFSTRLNTVPSALEYDR